MKCESIRNKIDQWVFEGIDVESPEIKTHIETCKTCNSYYHKSLRSSGLIDQLKNEPILEKSVEFTQDILRAIDVDYSLETKDSNSKVLPFIIKSLAAASISLMIIFGVEQYVVFDKISRMETFVAQKSNQAGHSTIKSLISYNPGLNLEALNKLFSEGHKPNSSNSLRNKIKRSRLTTLALNSNDRQHIIRVMHNLSIMQKPRK